MLIWLLVVAGVIILDQGSKALVMYALGLDKAGESIPLIENVLHFTHVKNTGAAFGMFGEENQRWIFMVISVLGICALLVYLWKFRPQSRMACAAFSMVIGGGIGNMIDRTFRVGVINGKERNYVFDFIDFRGFGDLWEWTFNVADAFVCIGAGILIVWCIVSFVNEIKAERLKKQAAAEGEAEPSDVGVEQTDSKDATEDDAEVVKNPTEDIVKENGEENKEIGESEEK